MTSLLFKDKNELSQMVVQPKTDQCTNDTYFPSQSLSLHLPQQQSNSWKFVVSRDSKVALSSCFWHQKIQNRRSRSLYVEKDRDEVFSSHECFTMTFRALPRGFRVLKFSLSHQENIQLVFGVFVFGICIFDIFSQSFRLWYIFGLSLSLEKHLCL